MLETDIDHSMEAEDSMEIVIATAEGGVLLRVDLRGRQKLSLGRSKKCDVRLRGPGISRHHAILIEEAGRWVLIDTSAGNGVWLKHERVKVSPLAPDQPLRIGDSFLWFFGRNEVTIPPPRVEPYPAAEVALRGEYLESLWRSHAIAPVRAVA